MARRSESSARTRAREALAVREAARQEQESRIAQATQTFYEKTEAMEDLAELLVQAENNRDQALVSLAGEGLNAKEIATLTGLELKQVKAVLKAAKPAPTKTAPQTQPATTPTPSAVPTEPTTEPAHAGVAA